MQATIERLVQFGTRHTASSQTDPVRGIGAATAWVFEQMQAIAATSGGNMTVQQQTFVQPVSPNIPVPTTITNVIATLQGTASPQRFYVVTGHLDSRVTDVLNFTDDAPGADDDGSGVALALEPARLFATHQFPGTIVFATVDGGEQGLYGSSFMAAQMPPAFFRAVEETVSETLRHGVYGWELTGAVITMTHSGYLGKHSIGHARFTKSLSSTGKLTPLVLMSALRQAGTWCASRFTGSAWRPRLTRSRP